MAKIKFGMMMTDARGKLGGQVFSKNRAGAYVRTKVTPVNPQTALQQEGRELLGSLSQAWGTLQQNEVDAWNQAVDEWKTTDVFGDIKKPTGKNLFVKLNMVRNRYFPTAGILLSPPVKQALEIYVPESVSFTQSGPDILITMNEQLGVGEHFLVRFTPPLSRGISFVKNKYRVLGVFDTVVHSTGTGNVQIAIPKNILPAGYLAQIGLNMHFEVQGVVETGQLGVKTNVFAPIEI